MNQQTTVVAEGVLRGACVEVVETTIERPAEGTIFFRSADMLLPWYSPGGPEVGPLVARQLTDLFLTSIIRAEGTGR